MFRVLISAVLALCLLMPGCMLLTSCNSSNNDDEVEQGSDAEAPDESDGEAVDETVLTVTTVTKEQFEAAIAFDGVESVTLRIEHSYKYADSEGSLNSVIKFDKNKSDVVAGESGDNRMLFEKNGEHSGVYYYVSGGCYRMKLDEDSVPKAYMLEALPEIFEELKFEDFEYSDGIYKGVSELDGTRQNVTLSFEDGRLIGCTAKCEDEDFKSDKKMEFYDYGKTKVELPEDFVETAGPEETLPASAWSRRFQFKNVTILSNVKTEIVYDGDFEDKYEDVVAYSLKINGDKWLLAEKDRVVCYDGTATYVNGEADPDAESLELLLMSFDFSQNEADFTLSAPGVYEAEKLVGKYGIEYEDVVIAFEGDYIASIKYKSTVHVEDDTGSLDSIVTSEYSFSAWGTTLFDESKYTSPSEWMSYFKLDNVTVTQSIAATGTGVAEDIELYTVWKLNDGEWSCVKDVERLDDTTTKQDFVYYDGIDGYVNNKVSGLAQKYMLELDDLKTALMVNESEFTKNGDKLESQCVRGYYRDVEITVSDGKIVKIVYTLDAGVEIDGNKHPAQVTLTFTDYGTTSPDQYRN